MGAAGGVGGAIAEGGGAGGCSSGVFLPKSASVVPEITPPPMPPFRPALRKRSRFFSVKNSLLSPTNFSAAALDISCTASVEPSVAAPIAVPLPNRLSQAPTIFSFGMPVAVTWRKRLNGRIASSRELNPPNASAVPRLSLPVDSFTPWYTSGMFCNAEPATAPVA